MRGEIFKKPIFMHHICEDAEAEAEVVVSTAEVAAAAA
jgi:hypothetical protein